MGLVGVLGGLLGALGGPKGGPKEQKACFPCNCRYFQGFVGCCKGVRWGARVVVWRATALRNRAVGFLMFLSFMYEKPV